jgi:hypothetical protein
MPIAPTLRRFPLVRSVRSRLLDMNSEVKRRAPMDPALRRRLLDEQAPEIERLGRLIGRDLSPWLERGDGTAAPTTTERTPAPNPA